MSDNFKISPPWDVYYTEIQELFGHDPDIELEFDRDNKEITMRVQNAAKADALSKILAPEVTFGDITVRLTIIPANEESIVSLYEKAFTGNPAFVTTMESKGFNYIVFKRKVVQYYIDNLGSLGGLRSTLYENIADRVIEDHNGVFFCTNIGADDECDLWNVSVE